MGESQPAHGNEEAVLPPVLILSHDVFNTVRHRDRRLDEPAATRGVSVDTRAGCAEAAKAFVGEAQPNPDARGGWRLTALWS